MHRVLLGTILTIGGTFLVLTVLIVANKARRESGEAWRRRRRGILEPLILSYAHAEDRSSRPPLGGVVPRRDKRVVEEILLDHIQRVRGIERERLGLALDELGYVDRYMDGLWSRRWWRRAEAAEKLGLARARRATGRLVAALEDDVPEVRMRAAKALGAVGGSTAVGPLVAALGEPNRWSSIRVADILAEMGREAVERIATEYPAMNLHARLAALDILARLRPLRLVAWLRTLLDDPERDVRARACHAIGAIGEPGSGPVLAKALADREWPVRAMAAKALGRVRHAEAIPELCAALRDPEWWVRANAAEALRQLGPKGIEALDRMLDDRDVYARHQAVLMLEESGVLDEKVDLLARPESPERTAAEALVRRFVRIGQVGRLLELAETHRSTRARETVARFLGPDPREG